MNSKKLPDVEVRCGWYGNLVVSPYQIKILKFQLEQEQHYREQKEQHELLMHALKLKPFWKLF